MASVGDGCLGSREGVVELVEVRRMVMGGVRLSRLVGLAVETSPAPVMVGSDQTAGPHALDELLMGEGRLRVHVAAARSGRGSAW